MVKNSKNMVFCTSNTCVFLLFYVFINQISSSYQNPNSSINYPLSIYKMVQLLEIDEEVIPRIIIAKSRQNITTRQRKICQNFISEFEKIPQNAKQDSIQNILVIHQIIRRYYQFPKHLVQDAYLDMDEIFSRKGAKWPDAQDLLESIDSINRLVEHYDLEPKDVRNGEFNIGSKGSKSSENIRLNAYTCFQIGTRSYNMDQFALAYRWLELARNILLTEKDWSISLDEVETSLSQAIDGHDQNFLQYRDHYPKLFFNATILPYKEGKKLFRSLSKNDTENLSPKEKNKLKFKALCKGENLMNDKERSRLYCQYRHFYLRIRVEFLSKDPEIIQIYNFFANDEPIENIKRATIKNLEPSAVVRKISDSDNPYSVITDTRSSHSTFEGVYNNTWLRMAENRISLITGLELKKKFSSEIFQVTAYAPGGHYGFHSDTLGALEHDGIKGERIATFMIYLSDVKIGGSTVFFQGQIAAKPIKGSAVFWWNQKKDGTILENIHGGCPTVEGHKWIINKWIRYPEQFRNRPCELEPGK